MAGLARLSRDGTCLILPVRVVYVAAVTIAAVALQWVSVSLGEAPQPEANILEGSSRVERGTVNADVAGSNPALPANPPDLTALTTAPIVLAPTFSARVEAAAVRVSSQGGTLTEEELFAVLVEAGWPTELIPAALRVAFCESRWSPGAVGDGGSSLGLFQLNRLWFGYAGESVEQWADALVNARTALATYHYDIARGSIPWKQWTCRP